MKKIKIVFLLLVIVLIFTSCENSNNTIINNTTTKFESNKSYSGTKQVSSTSKKKAEETYSSTTGSESVEASSYKSDKEDNNTNTSIILREKIPEDKFSSISEMISKAKNYKTVDDIYISSGFKKDDCYYKKFEEKELEMILKDKQVMIPHFSDDIKFIRGSLMPWGYYCFTQYFYPDQDAYFSLFISTYKQKYYELKKDKEFKKLKPKYTINNNDIYYYNCDYCWTVNDYLIQLRLVDESCVEEVISQLQIETVKI